MKNLNQECQIEQSKSIELKVTWELTQHFDDKIQIPKLTQQSNNNHSSISYKPHIDGLRTIAIITVVIYHAFPEVMPGGFIGVDVFFVISGYLISQIIIKETKLGSFSYINFYCRRIKRIYPALLLILTFVLYVVYKYYRLVELEFALKTQIASTVFGANFQVLTHEKGYFDPDIHVNPLLHLWSLGVQEQFYIFWPCLISIGLNVFKKRTFLVLALYTVFSFIFGIISVFYNPNFAFYFPICRFWQMAVGGLVAYLNIKIQNEKIPNALSICGTLAILVTVWIIDDESLFPGFWVLIPTMASAFIIQAGSQPFINKHILSSKIFVFIGKISYPMYLWHWPLLVFSRYLYPEGSKSIFSNLYFIILFTVVLSIGTYYLIENPIRKIKTKKVALILLILILAIGWFSYRSIINARERQEILRKDVNYVLAEGERQMIPRREDYIQRNGKKHPNLSKNRNRKYPTIQKITLSGLDFQHDHEIPEGEVILQKKIEEGSQYFVKDRPFLHQYQVANEGRQNKVFLIGDSHALRLAYRFQQLHKESIAQNTTDKFPTVLGIIKGLYPPNSTNQLFSFSMSMIEKHKPRRMLILFHWPIYYCNWRKNNFDDNQPQCDYEEFEKAVTSFIQWIKSVQSLGVQATTATINFHTNHLSMFQVDQIIDDNIKPISRNAQRNKFARLFDFYEKAMRDANIQVLDLSDNLCYQDVCEVLTSLGYGVYTDPHHYGKFYARHWLSVVDHLVEF